MLAASAEQADRSATTTTSTPTATSPAALMSSDAATAASPVSAEYGAPPFPGSFKPGQADGDQIMWYFAWGGQAGRDAIFAELKGRDCVGFPFAPEPEPPPSLVVPKFLPADCKDLLAKLGRKRRLYGRDEIAVCLAIWKRTGHIISAVDAIRTVHGYEHVSKGMLSRWRKNRMNPQVFKSPGRRVNRAFEVKVRDKLVFTIKVPVPGTEAVSALASASSPAAAPAPALAPIASPGVSDTAGAVFSPAALALVSCSGVSTN